MAGDLERIIDFITAMRRSRLMKLQEAALRKRLAETPESAAAKKFKAFVATAMAGGATRKEAEEAARLTLGGGIAVETHEERIKAAKEQRKAAAREKLKETRRGLLELEPEEDSPKKRLAEEEALGLLKDVGKYIEPEEAKPLMKPFLKPGKRRARWWGYLQRLPERFRPVISQILREDLGKMREETAEAYEKIGLPSPTRLPRQIRITPKKRGVGIPYKYFPPDRPFVKW